MTVVRRHAATLVTVALVAAIAALYVWTAAPGGSTTRAPDRYNALVDAWRHGQLALLQTPSPAFQALPDPFDPAANAPFRGSENLLDLSYYKGHLYFSSWGPTPALLLYLPARWLGPDVRMTDRTALVILCLLGLLSLVALARLLIRRLVPDAPAWMGHVGTLVLGLGSVAPFVLRNPGVYQVAQASGFAFFFVGLALIAHGTLGQRVRPWLLALGSLSLGLAMGGRFTYVLSLALAGGVLAWLVRGGRLADRRSRALTAGALLGPALACVAGLLVLNRLRYGSFTEFGLHHLLNDAVPGDQQRLVNIAPNGWFYLFAPVSARGDFPFFFLGSPANYPGTLPARYFTPEYTGGLLPTQPFLLLLLGLPVVARLRGMAPVAWIAVGLVALGAGMLVIDAFGVPVATQRYELDMAPSLLLAALLVWIVLGTRLRRAPARVAVQGLGLLAALVGCVVAVALSIVGQSDRALLAADPQAWFRLAHRLRFVSPLTGSLHFGTVTEEATVGALLLAALALTASVAWRLGAPWARHGTAALAAGAIVIVAALGLGAPAAADGAARLSTTQGVALALGTLLVAAGWALRGRGDAERGGAQPSAGVGAGAVAVRSGAGSSLTDQA